MIRCPRFHALCSMFDAHTYCGLKCILEGCRFIHCVAFSHANRIVSDDSPQFGRLQVQFFLCVCERYVAKNRNPKPKFQRKTIKWHRFECLPHYRFNILLKTLVFFFLSHWPVYRLFVSFVGVHYSFCT